MPDPEDVGQILSDLADLVERPAAFAAEDRRSVLARKDRLAAAVRVAAQDPQVEPLAPSAQHERVGFRWGTRDSSGLDLARAILRVEIDGEPRTTACEAFLQDVIAELPRHAFRLPAERVQEWLAANPDLASPMAPRPERESDEAAHAVTDLEPPDETPLEEATASALVRACEAAWAAIKVHHPELPDAVIILGSGVERGRLVKLGHWWAGRWLADGQVRGEVLLAGEALHLTAKEVFEVLLHEAAHGLNAARGVRDTSRGGRYHNQRFADAAREVLLRVRAMPPYGLASTAATPESEERYENAIAGIGEAMRIVRQVSKSASVGEGGPRAGEGGVNEGSGGGETGRRSDTVAAVCECGRRLRMAPTVFERGEVVCVPCGGVFRDPAQPKAPKREGEVEPEVEVDQHRSPVNESFVDRRRAALQSESAELEPRQLAAIRAQLARLDAVIGAFGGAAELAPIAQRADRLRDAAAIEDSPETPLTEDQLEGLVNLQALQPRGQELEVLSSWYQRAGRLDEEPMPLTSAEQRDRGVRLARALLKLDGTLRGPALPFGDVEVQAGDRLVTHDYLAVADIAAGVAGTVRRVDPDKGLVEIDFATEGTITARPSWLLDAGVGHDYVSGARVEAEHAGKGPELDEAELEAHRLGPELGW